MIVNARRSTTIRTHRNGGISVFALRCEQDTFLIGQTKQKVGSFDELLQTSIAPWMRPWLHLHKPVKLECIYCDCSSFDEDKYVKQYMHYYGVENVRGGSYCSIILDPSLLRSLKHEFDYIDFMRSAPESAKLSSSLLSSQLGMNESISNSILANSYVVDEKSSSSRQLTKPNEDDPSWQDWFWEQYVTARDMTWEMSKVLWPWK